MSVETLIQDILNTRTTYAEAGLASLPKSAYWDNYLVENQAMTDDWDNSYTTVAPGNGYIKARFTNPSQNSLFRCGLAFYSVSSTQEVTTNEPAALFVPVVKGGTIIARTSHAGTLDMIFVPLTNKGSDVVEEEDTSGGGAD